MIQRLSENIVSWQIKRNILTGEESALYKYAYEVMINQVVNISIALLVAVIFNAYMSVLIFLFSYIPLRSYCGGYHAKTNGGCTVVSAVLIFLVCMVEKVVSKELITLLVPILIIFSGALIFRYAPAPDKNKPLDEFETMHYRKKSRLVWLVEAIIGAAFWCFGLRASVVIAISHAMLSLMLVYGVYKNRKACD